MNEFNTVQKLQAQTGLVVQGKMIQNLRKNDSVASGNLLRSIKVNNVEMDISLWVKESAKGTKFFSASFQEPFVKPTTTEPNVKINNIENDLPF